MPNTHVYGRHTCGGAVYGPFDVLGPDGDDVTVAICDRCGVSVNAPELPAEPAATVPA